MIGVKSARAAAHYFLVGVSGTAAIIVLAGAGGGAVFDAAGLMVAADPDVLGARTTTGEGEGAAAAAAECDPPLVVGLAVGCK